MDKPAISFNDEQFLLVQKAEKEGFITVTIKTEEKDLLQEMEPLYTRSVSTTNKNNYKL